MTKSVWKIPNILTLKPSLKPYYIKKRNLIISFFFIGKTIFVYNGKNYKKFIVTREHVGFKFGEFIFTKNSSKHLKKKKVTLKKNGTKK